MVRALFISRAGLPPCAAGTAQTARTAQAGVCAAVFTNALGSTDAPLVRHMDSRYEFSPRLKQRSLAFGDFGRSTPRQHRLQAALGC